VLGASSNLATTTNFKVELLLNIVCYLVEVQKMNICVNCNKETSNPKFCSSSCNASYKNKNNHWRKQKGIFKGLSNCITCGNQCKKTNSKFCSAKCQREKQYQEKLTKWLNSDIDKFGRNQIRRYLIETYGYKCSHCGISEHNNKPLVLQVEHIDGNSENNRPENLCLLCPNCHSQTPTFGNKNRGNGRHWRRLRYAQGKSY
jgi:hypothetical protein